MVGVAAASTPAWLHRGGSRQDAGTLQIAFGRVSFSTADGVVFAAAAADVGARWPWYYFGAGLKLVIGRNTYTVSFVGPRKRFQGLASARRTGRQWQQLLGSPPGV